MLAQYDEKDGFSFLNGGEIADDVADALNKLQPGMIATSGDFEKLAKRLGTSDQKLINFCTDLKNGNITLKEGQTYLQAYQENVTSLSARLKSLATSAKAFFKNLGGNLLAGTINALGGMLISSVVSLIGVGVSKLYKQISGKAAEEAKQEIQQLGETARSEFDSIQQNLSSTISTVDEVKQHYAELAQGVGDLGKATQNQGTLTTDDYKDFLDISNQLSDLFPTLIQGYDDNGNAIINLNGDVTTITSSLNSLVEAQKAVASQQIADKMPDIYSDYRQNVSDYADEYNNDLQAMQKAQEAMSYVSDPSNYSIDQNGNAFQYLPYFNGIEEVMTKYGLDYDQWMNEWGNGFDTYVSLDDNEKTIFENIYQDIFNQYSKSLIDLEKRIDNENKQFGQYVTQSLYDDSTYQDFSKNDPQKKDIVDSIISNLDYDTVTAKYGKDWGEAYKDLIQRQIINSIAGIDDTKVTDAINKVLNQELSVSDFNDNIAIIQGYDNDHTEVDFSSWLNPKIESMQAAQDTYNNIINRFKPNVDARDVQQIKNGTQYRPSNEDASKISTFLDMNGISQDLDSLTEFNEVTADITDADEAIQAWTDHVKEAGGEVKGLPTTMAEAWKQLKASTNDSTKGVADALTALADKGELTIKTFSETDGAKNYFDGLNVSAEEAVKYINSLSDKNSQLSAMSKNIKSITDALGTKASDGLVSVDDLSGFDATIKGLNTWEKFSTILGDASSSMKDCQKVANELATEYVNSESVLSNLNETNRAYYESQLDNMGVTNSAAVVEAALAKNLGEEKIATEEAIKAGLSLHGTKIDTTNATELFSNATAGEIIQLANEANQSGVSSQALALLAVKKLNNPTLTTDGDIKNLMDLCKGLDLATEAIKTFQSIKNNVMNPDGSIKASSSSEEIAKENALNTAYDKMKSIIKTSVSGASVNSHGTSGGGTSSGGGGGSSTTKTPFDYLADYAGTFFDWIEVRLDRLQKKIDSNISKAESKLNDKRYSSATANYMSAINVTYDKINDTKAGRDEYIKYANNYINKAISLKAINKNLAEEIKSRVADGSINISEYNSDIQTVISTYKDWIDKAKDCTTAIQTLHDSLRTYAEDLKKVSDAQRDATVSMAETKQTIATGGVQNTISAKNTALNYNNIVLNTKNKAYSTATKSAASNVNKLAGSANSALNKGKVKDNAKYNTTLKNIKKYIKKRAIIPDSLLGIVAKRNTSLYNRLYMYNLGIENLKTAREEYTTAYAANNAEKYNNIAEKYKNLDDATNDEMDYNSSVSDNSVYAKNKNKYLNKKSSGYTQMYYRDVSEANVYGALTRKAKAQIKNPSRKSLGTSYSSLSTKMMKAVRSCISSARKSASHNKVISSSIIARLTEYVKKGYVSQSFLDSCISYNNALESYNQAKTQAAIDKQTQIAQRAEIASQKFSNISTEYDNKRHKYDQASTELNNKMSTLEAKGNGASANWYKRLKGNETLNNTSLIQKRQSLITSLNNSVKTGAIKKYSTEWYELRSQIDDVTNAIDNSKKALAEYDNQINQIHWDRIDELVQKRQNLIDESDFMINELSRRDLTSDDTGGLTAEGNAVAGLHVANYKAYKASATTYANEIASINKKLAKDPYNQTLIEQKEKLVKSYQDCVKGAEDEKFSIISLIENGYTALSNKIKNLISDYEDLLDKQSDAYSYSESINEKTKTLSDLRKQLVAISGDTSEETRAKKQELNQSLKDAEKDLKDTQYDKLISSTKDMLSDFQTDLDDSIQDIIKSLDDNFTNLVSEIDSKWDDSNDAITKLMESIQYESSKQFEMVTSDGKVSQNTYNAISNIYEFMQKAWTKYDTDAKEAQRYTVSDANPSGSKTNPQIKGLNTKTGLGEFKHGKVSPPETLGSFGKGKILSSSTKKEIEAFLAKNLVKAKNKYENYGVLNKKMYKAYNGKVLPISKWTELAKMIGFDNYSPNTNSAFYQTLRMSGIKGFKKGSDSIPYDMIANLGENGTELQYDVSKGVLKSVGQGDMIFTAEEAKTLMEFAKNPMAYKNMYTGTAFSMPSVPVNNKVDNDVNISIGDIKLEGVQDPKQLANGIKDVIKNNTGGVRSMIKEDTIGSLSKGYNSQSVKRW